MAWLYRSGTGQLFDATGALRGVGYSGHHTGYNNPALDGVPFVGPIPRGQWTIAGDATTGEPYASPDHGPFVLRLLPAPETETHGRDAFLLHGDSKTNPGEASLGCVVMPRTVRESVWESGDRELVVTP